MDVRRRRSSARYRPRCQRSGLHGTGCLRTSCRCRRRRSPSLPFARGIAFRRRRSSRRGVCRWMCRMGRGTLAVRNRICRLGSRRRWLCRCCRRRGRGLCRCQRWLCCRIVRWSCRLRRQRRCRTSRSPEIYRRGCSRGFRRRGPFDQYSRRCRRIRPCLGR